MQSPRAFRSRLVRLLVAGTTAAILGAVPLFVVAQPEGPDMPSEPTQPSAPVNPFAGPVIFTSGLDELNANATPEIVSGDAIFIRSGDVLTVVVNVEGLEPGPHQMHIHAGPGCPDVTADVNHDRLVDIAEGLPSYGPVIVPLDDDLDDLAHGEFPVAGPDGSLHYLAWGSVPEIEAAIGMPLQLSSRAVVVHGVPGDPSLPVACGAVTYVPE